jgi:hypothetical protein
MKKILMGVTGSLILGACSTSSPPPLQAQSATNLLVSSAGVYSGAFSTRAPVTLLSLYDGSAYLHCRAERPTDGQRPIQQPVGHPVQFCAERGSIAGPGADRFLAIAECERHGRRVRPRGNAHDFLRDPGTVFGTRFWSRGDRGRVQRADELVAGQRGRANAHRARRTAGGQHVDWLRVSRQCFTR